MVVNPYTEALEAQLIKLLPTLRALYHQTSSSSLFDLIQETEVLLASEALPAVALEITAFEERRPTELETTKSGKVWLYKPAYPPLQPAFCILGDPTHRSIDCTHWISVHKLPILVNPRNPFYRKGRRIEPIYHTPNA